VALRCSAGWGFPCEVNELSVISLRAMAPADLQLIAKWLLEPHVARWYLAGSGLEREIQDLRRCISGVEPTHALMVLEDGRPIGWCQWYLCGDYPEHAAAVDAAAGNVGIDYAIGDRARVGRGVGTTLIAVLVAQVRQEHPAAGVLADPEVTNVASRRVLEKNGFTLLKEASIPTEPAGPVAIYRLETAGEGL
jgi:aminoglycoside 6'-N-acetyltransferase